MDALFSKFKPPQQGFIDPAAQAEQKRNRWIQEQQDHEEDKAKSAGKRFRNIRNATGWIPGSGPLLAATFENKGREAEGRDPLGGKQVGGAFNKANVAGRPYAQAAGPEGRPTGGSVARFGVEALLAYLTGGQSFTPGSQAVGQALPYAQRQTDNPYAQAGMNIAGSAASGGINAASGVDSITSALGKMPPPAKWGVNAEMSGLQAFLQSRMQKRAQRQGMPQMPTPANPFLFGRP